MDTPWDAIESCVGLVEAMIEGDIDTDYSVGDEDRESVSAVQSWLKQSRPASE